MIGSGSHELCGECQLPRQSFQSCWRRKAEAAASRLVSSCLVPSPAARHQDSDRTATEQQQDTSTILISTNKYYTLISIILNILLTVPAKIPFPPNLIANLAWSYG